MALPVSGIVSATINGQPVNIFECSWMPNNTKSEPVICLNGHVGPKKSFTVGEVSFKILCDAFSNVSDFSNGDNTYTIQIVMANGKSILASDAYVVDTQTVNAEEATFELKFASSDISEVS